MVLGNAVGINKSLGDVIEKAVTALREQISLLLTLNMPNFLYKIE